MPVAIPMAPPKNSASSFRINPAKPKLRNNSRGRNSAVRLRQTPAWQARIGWVAFACDVSSFLTMSRAKERDYVLGTHDQELERLGVQHEAWRPVVLDCWKNAGVTSGSRVLDVGAGPGYATVDLAEIVGPSGKVVAVERSTNFVSAIRRTIEKR